MEWNKLMNSRTAWPTEIWNIGHRCHWTFTQFLGSECYTYSVVIHIFSGVVKIDFKGAVELKTEERQCKLGCFGVRVRLLLRWLNTKFVFLFMTGWFGLQAAEIPNKAVPCCNMFLPNVYCKKPYPLDFTENWNIFCPFIVPHLWILSTFNWAPLSKIRLNATPHSP